MVMRRVRVRDQGSQAQQARRPVRRLRENHTTNPGEDGQISGLNSILKRFYPWPWKASALLAGPTASPTSRGSRMTALFPSGTWQPIISF